MGFFSDIVNNVFTDNVKNEAGKVAGDLDNAFKNMGDEISKTFSNTPNTTTSNTVNNNSNYTIPEEYKEFPVFDGNIQSLDTKKTDKYQRCTIKYNNLSEDSVTKYRNMIVEAGYNKATDVRYEKNNSYIIVDFDGSDLELVYHIKF